MGGNEAGSGSYDGFARLFGLDEGACGNEGGVHLAGHEGGEALGDAHLDEFHVADGHAFFGESGDEQLMEHGALGPGDGFTAQVCKGFGAVFLSNEGEDE